MTRKNICECCGLRDADKTIGGNGPVIDALMPLIGATYAHRCFLEFENSLPYEERLAHGSYTGSIKFGEKVRARRAALAHRKTDASLCKSRRNGGTCCKTGEHLVHQSSLDTNTIGWLDYATSNGMVLEIAICVTDTQQAIEGCARATISATGAHRVYGTQPEKLPKTLPAGTRASVDGTLSTAKERLILGVFGERSCYMREGERFSLGWSWPEHIDWSRVAVQEEKLDADVPEPLGQHLSVCDWCKDPSSRQERGSTCLAYLNALDERLALGTIDCPEERESVKRFVDGRFALALDLRTAIEAALVSGPTCLYCKSPPAAEHDCCAYCRQRIKETGTHWHNEPDNILARSRIEASVATARALASQRPTSRARGSQLPGHPSTWPSQEGEEP